MYSDEKSEKTIECIGSKIEKLSWQSTDWTQIIASVWPLMIEKAPELESNLANRLKGYGIRIASCSDIETCVKNSKTFYQKPHMAEMFVHLIVQKEIRQRT